MKAQRILWAAAIAATAACANMGSQESKSSVVADADVGRLPQDQESVIDAARREQANANDALSQARLKLQDAQNEEQVAKADIASAAAEKNSADANQLGSDQSREPTAQARSQKRQDVSEAHKIAARARLDYAQKLVEARQAAVAAAEQQVKVSNARLEQSKLKALQQARNPAAGKYDPGRFETAVYDAKLDLDQMEKRSKNLDQEASLLRQNWQTAQRQWEAARQGSGG